MGNISGIYLFLVHNKLFDKRKDVKTKYRSGEVVFIQRGVKSL